MDRTFYVHGVGQKPTDARWREFRHELGQRHGVQPGQSWSRSSVFAKKQLFRMTVDHGLVAFTEALADPCVEVM